jgi:hypothetical protein
MHCRLEGVHRKGKQQLRLPCTHINPQSHFFTETGVFPSADETKNGRQRTDVKAAVGVGHTMLNSMRRRISAASRSLTRVLCVSISRSNSTMKLYEQVVSIWWPSHTEKTQKFVPRHLLCEKSPLGIIEDRTGSDREPPTSKRYQY